MDERGFFDHLASSWDENEVLSTPEKVREIINYFNLKEGQRVLDLGTGTGVLLPYIAEKIGEKGEIVAVDYSTGMLERAKEKYSTLIPAPLFLNLDFENETIPGEFDRIILYCVYPHLHNPVDTLKWLSKVNLAEGGHISIAFPCGPDFINNIHREKHSESDRLVSASLLTDFLVKNGFQATVAAESDGAYVVNLR